MIQAPGSLNPEASNAIGQRILQINTQQYEIKMAERRHYPAPVTEQPSSLEPNPWVERAGWRKHLAGFIESPDQIRSWKNVDPNDLILGGLLDTFLNLLRYGQQLATENVLGLPCMEYISRLDNGEAGQRPFTGRFQEATMDRYISAWSDILIYIYNTRDLALWEKPSYR